MDAMSRDVLPIITYPQDLYLGQLFDLHLRPILTSAFNSSE